MAEPLHIEGTVENILFRNEENGYVVLDLDAGGEPVTVVGSLAILTRANACRSMANTSHIRGSGRSFRRNHASASSRTPLTASAVISPRAL